MYFSLNWLKELVEIPKNITNDELALQLTLHTVEVDGVESEKGRFNKIVVGKILSVDVHPNADRLQLTKIDIGGKQNLNIVCGATNIESGQKVPVAMVGAVLPNGLEIKEAEVRGEKSIGMLCAEDELGLGNDHSGIMILDADAKVGQNLADYLKLKDTIFEVDNKSLTNRPDLLNHLGIAREISVFLNTKLTKEFSKIENVKLPIIPDNVEQLNINVNDFGLCPRYMAIKITDLEVRESPKWLQKRLSAIGMRPINNVVDIVNYIMLEIGQPMHTFDADLVDKIVVRRADNNERIVTLDGEERKLDSDMLVIADSKKPIAIAGVIGGGNSEINKNTTSIIIESANFEAVQVRKTSKKIGLRTEASLRYEKALDPNLTENGIALACKLIKKVCPKAKISSKLSDISLKTKDDNFGLNLGPIDIEIDWLRKKIGQEISEKKIIDILEKLCFKVTKKDSVLSIKIPSWRATKDISIKEDILEEVARIYGYENIKAVAPRIKLKSPLVNKKRYIERKIKNILAIGLSMTESYNYSFTNEDKIKKMNIDLSGYIKIANPISANHTILRQSLIVNLLDNIKTNQANYKVIDFFEIGDVYMDFPGIIRKDVDTNETLPYQETRLGIIHAVDNDNDIFNSIKGKIEYLLNYFNLLADFSSMEITPGWADNNVCASINVEGKDIGVVAKIDKTVLRNLGIKKEVVVAEINFDKLFDIITVKTNVLYKKRNRFPVIMRDLAFIVSTKVLYSDIKNDIMNFKSSEVKNNYIQNVELFDVYIGDNIEKNKKSLAFHIIYSSPEKTLTSSNIDIVQNGIIEKLKDKYDAKIRDF